MGLILLEALLALGLLVFLVWWTMFSGRKRGEPPDHASNLARKSPHPVAPAPSKENPPQEPPH